MSSIRSYKGLRWIFQGAPSQALATQITDLIIFCLPCPWFIHLRRDSLEESREYWPLIGHLINLWFIGVRNGSVFFARRVIFRILRKLVLWCSKFKTISSCDVYYPSFKIYDRRASPDLRWTARGSTWNLTLLRTDLVWFYVCWNSVIFQRNYPSLYIPYMALCNAEIFARMISTRGRKLVMWPHHTIRQHILIQPRKILPTFCK